MRHFETLYITLMQFASLCTTLRQSGGTAPGPAATAPPGNKDDVDDKDDDAVVKVLKSSN